MFSDLLQLLLRRADGGGKNAAETPKATPGGDCQEHPTVAAWLKRLLIVSTSGGGGVGGGGGAKAAGRGSVYVRRRATTSRVRRHPEKKRKKRKKRQCLVKNQSGAELQSGGNQEASYAAEPFLGLR